MTFWIFKCNPELYRLDDRLADPNPTISWKATRYQNQISPKDTAFIWTTGKQRGIRAVLRVDEAPRMMAELEYEQQYWAERDTQVTMRVVCTITHRNVNLPHNELRSVIGLEQLSVFHGFQQATNFTVTPEQGNILLDLISGD